MIEIHHHHLKLSYFIIIRLNFVELILNIFYYLQETLHYIILYIIILKLI